MAISLKHKFVSPKPDDTDTTLVRPSNWNDEHALSLVGPGLVGRATGGAGAAEEIGIGASLLLSGTTLSFNITWGDARYELAFAKKTAFNKDFGTTAGTVTQGNDARLSNAREWTAEVVAQNEAETGTATTPRKWTAQRVRQAILGWWNNSSDKSKLDLAYGWGNHASEGYGKKGAHNTWEGFNRFHVVENEEPITIAGGSANDKFLQLVAVNKGANTSAAGITFHRAGAYAVHFGLDVDNKLKFGGWSLGSNAYEIFHEGNKATASDLRAGVVSKPVTAEVVYSANAPVTSSGSGSWAPDFAAGRKFARTLTGASTLANPTNQVAGQEGLIYIIQDGTGGRTLAYGTDWKHLGGAATIATTAGAVNVFAYYVRAVGEITLSYLGVEV